MVRLSRAILKIGLRGVGVSNFDPSQSDQRRFLLQLENRLRRNPVVFDIGANRGQFAKLVRESIPDARIHAFEPNPHAFADLERAFSRDSNIALVQAAMGAECRKAFLFDYEGGSGSEHASLVEGVIDEIHGGRPERMQVEVATIDSYVAEQEVDWIDLLKIDVEGSEMDVLNGATQTIARDAVHVLQIEFNEMHVLSRTFVRDIMDALPRHRVYRLLRSGELFDLTNERTVLRELYGYQNLIALPDDGAFDPPTLNRNTAGRDLGEP